MILYNLLEYILNNKESFSNKEKKDDDIDKQLYLYLFGYNPDLDYNDLSPFDIFNIAIIYLLKIIIAITAAYLSYSCTWNGTVKNFFIRILFALWAFLLGPLYLIWYFIVNWLFRACING